MINMYELIDTVFKIVKKEVKAPESTSILHRLTELREASRQKDEIIASQAEQIEAYKAKQSSDREVIDSFRKLLKELKNEEN